MKEGTENREGDERARGRLTVRLVTDDPELIGLVRYLETEGCEPGRKETLVAVLKAGYAAMAYARLVKAKEKTASEVAAAERLLRDIGLGK